MERVQRSVADGAVDSVTITVGTQARPPGTNLREVGQVVTSPNELYVTSPNEHLGARPRSEHVGVHVARGGKLTVLYARSSQCVDSQPCWPALQPSLVRYAAWMLPVLSGAGCRLSL
jgi:hypothetical protein